MNRMIWWGGSLLLLAMILTGCSGNTTTEAAHPGEEVPMFREYSGQQGPFPDRGFYVINRPEEWTALWAGRQAPEVDFTQQSVLVALMGQQPTGGYSIAITDIRATGVQVVAYLRETRPQTGETVANMPTNPYAMAVVPKVNQQVAFQLDGAANQPIAIQRLYQGQYANAVNGRTVVIRDEQTWNTFWAQTVGGAAPVPTVDFTQDMAIAVLIGQRPTGGYAVNINAVTQTPQRLEVNYRIRTPQPGEIVTQAQTSPFAIAIVPASPQAVAFLQVTTPVFAAVP